jgi:2-dehydropantoate 2-reductase
MTDDRILLVGTGAMASLFAALFSRKGLSVIMLGSWRENIEYLNENGVHFTDQEGNESHYPVEATDDPRRCIGIHLAIVLVKSFQTADAALRLNDCLSEDGIALTLQNGLGNDEILISSLGAKRVISGVTTQGATLIGPGSVRFGGAGVTSISDHENARYVADIFQTADLEIEILPETESLLWGKLVINASINPLTGLLGLKNGDLLENLFVRNLMGLVAEESAEIAGAAGIELPFTDPVKKVETVARKTAKNYSSMYIDFQRGGLTEIDAINGAVCRVGDKYNLPAKYNRALWMLVKAKTEV